jgi:dethiobiotin synthetase
MNRPRSGRIIFVTGTDTGVGKTVLTALLLCHLRRSGCRALAMKPFCSGSRADARLLYTLQDRELALEEINPFYFPEPVAPLVAARQHRRQVRLEAVLERIFRVVSSLQGLAQRPTPGAAPGMSLGPEPCLLVEGSGGLLVPLGVGYTVLDLIAALCCEVIVVGRNRLGTLNHCLLTVRTLQGIGLQRLRVVLMGCRRCDIAAASNPDMLAELVAPIPVQVVPHLGLNWRTAARLRGSAARLCRLLASLVRER